MQAGSSEGQYQVPFSLLSEEMTIAKFGITSQDQEDSLLEI